MNIAIGVLGIIDVILIYGIDIKMGDVIPEILIDVFVTILFLFFWNKVLENNEKSKIFFKWVTFIWLIVALIGIIWSIYKKSFMGVQTNFSIVIPLCLSYFILLIKIKKGEYD